MERSSRQDTQDRARVYAERRALLRDEGQSAPIETHPRGNQEVEEDEVRRGKEKLSRVVGN